MRVTMAFLACCFLVMAPGASMAQQPRVFSQITPQQLASILKDTGRKVEAGKWKDGSDYLKFDLIPGKGFQSYADFVGNGGGIVLSSHLGPTDVNMSNVNTFNAQWPYGNVYLKDDGGSAVQVGVVVAGGVTAANIKQNVALLRGMTALWVDVLVGSQ
jgi:hypothetical protein